MSGSEYKPNTVDVAVSMSPKLLEKINVHLEAIGEKNRSGWIRSAILVKMSSEAELLRDPDKERY